MSEKKKIIITIARQYGSGGADTGKKLAEDLGISFYDKNIDVYKRQHYYPVFVSVSGGPGVHHAVAERASSGIYIPLYRVYETGRKGSDWRIFSGTIPYHVCGGADSRGRIFGAGCPLRCPVGIFDGDSGFSADLWNWNGAVPMGGCEAVRGGVCAVSYTHLDVYKRQVYLHHKFFYFDS